MLQKDELSVDLPGFSTIDVKDDINDGETFKKSKSSKKGGFQSFGLSPNVLKGIHKRGYKLPTPIQRRVS